jgi:Rad3-related DNA helicase
MAKRTGAQKTLSTTKLPLSQQFRASVLGLTQARGSERKLLQQQVDLLAESMEQEIVELKKLLQEQRRRVTLAHAEAHQLREALDNQESASLKLQAELAEHYTRQDELAVLANDRDARIAALELQIARSTISWKSKSLLRRIKQFAWPMSRKKRYKVG